MASDQVAKAIALLRGLASGDADAAIRDIDPDRFVQHDPTVADGVAGLREQAARAVGGGLGVARVLEDGVGT